MHAESQAVLRRRENWWASILLLALLAVTHHDVIFLGRSIVSTNYSNPFDWRPLPENYGPNLVPHEEWANRNLWPYANIRDPGATWWQWEPAIPFLKQAMRDGEWPFWDPYIGGGSPAMANLVPAFFFPPFAIVILFGASNAMLNAYFLFLIWCSSFLTFLFLRRHELSPVAAGGGAAVLMLCGATQQHIGTFIGQTTYCLPFTMYATRVFLDQPGPRGATWIAAAYATTALASFPPVLLAIFGVTAIYALIGLHEQPADARLRAGGWWTCGVLLAVGLVAACYLPALAARAASPQVSEVYKHAGTDTMPPRYLYQLLSPTLMGGVQTYLVPPIASPGPYVPYVGIAALALALLASPLRQVKARTLTVACTLAVAGIVMKLLGWPVVQWVGTLPAFSEIHFAHYFGIPLGFLVSCLAALGLHALQRGALHPARAVAAAATAVLVVESLWWIGDSHGAFKSPSAQYWIRDWRVLATVTVLAAVACLVGTMMRHKMIGRHVAAIVLVSLAIVEGTYNGWFPNPARWNVFDHPVPFMRALQQHATRDRLLAFGALSGNLNSAFGVFSMGSLMAFNPPRAHDLYYHYSKPPLLEVFLRQSATLPPEPVLDRANVAVVVVNRALGDIVNGAIARGYSTIFDDGFIVLFKRPTLPKFFFGSAYRVVSPSDALDAIAAPDSREIVVEQDPGVPASPNVDTDPAVRVVAYHRNSVTIEVDAPRPGLVYASESYFDGWTALRNGSAIEILPANYAFRAVAVPAGLSRIEFRYWPPGLTAGLMISIVSMMAMVTVTVVSRRSSVD